MQLSVYQYVVEIFDYTKLGRKIRHSAANKQPYIKKDFLGEKTHFFKGY